jgi:hypothetical protein
MTDVPPPAPAGPPAPDPTRPLRVALRGITVVVAPTSLVSSLLFYFGWRRTSVQAQDMGLHESLLGFSTRDYVLRSIDPMRWPLVIGSVAAVLAIAGHLWLLDWVRTEPARARRRRLRRLTLAGEAAGALGLAAGGVVSRVNGNGRLVYLASPIVVTAGVIVAGYSLYVHRRFVAGRSRAKRPPEEGQLRLVASSLMVMLLLLSMFWTVDRYASVKGQDLAEEIVRDLDYLPRVTIYSAKRLEIQPPVTESDLGAGGDGDAPAAYRFRYSGLTLLFKADGKLFLRPSAGIPALNIVIPDGADLRFEFE